MISVYRWHYILKQLQQPLPYWLAMRYTMLGQVTGLLLPGRISGDIVRTLAAFPTNINKGALVLSTIIDKLALLAAIALFALVGAWGSSLLAQYSSIYVAALGLLGATVAALLLFARYRSTMLKRWLIKLQSANWLSTHIQQQIGKFSTMEDIPQLSARALLIVILLGGGFQLGSTIGNFILAQALHIPIGLVDWMAIIAIVSLVQLLPISLGGLGLREGTFASILVLYQVPPAQAVAFSFIGFVLATIMTILSWLAVSSVQNLNIHKTQVS
jgi:hypothetical protein